MARGLKKKARKASLRLPHNKDTLVQVGLNDADQQDVDALVELLLPARIENEPKFGRATVIREHAMPSIRRELELIRNAGREPVERGPERRSAVNV